MTYAALFGVKMVHAKQDHHASVPVCKHYENSP